ncbi:MAG: hypothetical protein Q8L48_16615 [Archangium sp.]|nr:hypothetical protein [Archangium sp.]
MSNYQELIVRLAGATVEEAPLVEAMMRVEHGTLDSLSNERFKGESQRALLEVKDDPAGARALAKSLGMMR